MPEPRRGRELSRRLLEPAEGEIELLYRARRRRARSPGARLAAALARTAALAGLRLRYHGSVAGELLSRCRRPVLTGWRGDLRGAVRQARRRPFA